jgi:hypothetical protein
MVVRARKRRAASTVFRWQTCRALHSLGRQTVLTYTPKVGVILGSRGERKLPGQEAFFWHYWRIGALLRQKVTDKFLWQFMLEKRKMP